MNQSKRRKVDIYTEPTHGILGEVYQAIHSDKIDIPEIERLLMHLMPLCWDSGAVVCFRLLCRRLFLRNQRLGSIWVDVFRKRWEMKRPQKLATKKSDIDPSAN